ncbi:MAG: hypothetical protein VW963_03360, partial [Candidatus Neomarinimicrobiota bacterium]
MIIKYFFSANKNIPRAVTLHPEPVQKNWTQKGFHKCYAHKWSQINKFYLRSFFDYDFNIVKTGKDNKLHIQHNPATNNPEITCHLKDQINDTQIAFQMPWNHIVFYSEETCFLEMQNCYEGPK